MRVILNLKQEKKEMGSKKYSKTDRGNFSKMWQTRYKTTYEKPNEPQTA